MEIGLLKDTYAGRGEGTRITLHTELFPSSYPVN